MAPRRGSALLFLTVGLALAVLPAASRAAPETVPDAFAPVPGFAGADEALAVAVAADGRVAVGDASGAWLAQPPAAARRVLRRGPAHDLDFDADGVLHVATERGLFAVAPDGTVRSRGPGPSDEARQVRRLTLAPDLHLAATAAGVFAAEPSEPFRRLDGRLPSGPVAGLALGRDPAGRPVLIALIEEEVWRARLANGRDGWHVRDAARLVLQGLAGPPRDVGTLPARGARSGATAGGALAVLGDRGLAVGGSSGSLRALPLDLPPGAEPHRLVHAGRRAWIASDAGLLALVVDAEGARARRVASPAGSVVAHDVAAAPRVLYVASARGLLAGALSGGTARTSGAEGADRASEPSEPSERSDPLGRFADEPDIREVHRAALAWLELRPGDLRGLRRRAGLRGLFPQLDLSAGYDGGRRHALEHDESFTYGELHHLRDEDWNRDRGFDVEIKLRWELGDAVYDDEELDLAKEAREVIELRDEVLDEINQLYHERRRVLLDASARSPGDPEAARLRLRAAELAAGLDAWTGGWWSRRLHAADEAASSPDRSPETQP